MITKILLIILYLAGFIAFVKVYGTIPATIYIITAPVIYFIICLIVKERKKRFNDWQMNKYGNIAESNQETSKRKREYKNNDK